LYLVISYWNRKHKGTEERKGETEEERREREDFSREISLCRKCFGRIYF
jgi:hypothetical protein